MRCLLMVSLILLTSCTVQAIAGTKEKTEAVESWFVIMLNDVRVGYRYVKDSKIKNDQVIFFRTEIKEYLKVKRSGQIFESTSSLTMLENEFGDIQSFDHKIETNGQGDVVSRGKVLAGNINVETSVGGKTKVHSVKLPLLTVSPEYPSRYFRTDISKFDVPITFNIFIPNNLTFNQVKFSKQGTVEQKLLDGKTQKLTKISLLNLATPVHKAFYLLDDQGEIQVINEENILGKMVSYKVTREIAMEDLAGEQLDLTISSMFEPKPALKLGHKAKKIVYDISAPDAALKWEISISLSHELKQISPGNIQITAHKVLIPELAQHDSNFKLDDYLQSCLKSTLFIQSDADEIVKLANLSSVTALNPASIAKLHEKYIFKKMSKNQFSSNLGSALEVAKSWQGDCTEHSVLLCALLRAKKIPARIAIGLVYLDGYKAFGGHMWTEVFLKDQWYSLDATQGQGGISPAYLKIGDTPLIENAPVPTSLLTPLLNIPRNLQIKIVSEE